VSVAGAIAVDLLVAQGMLAVHRWSVRGGIVAVTAISTLVLLLVVVRQLRKRMGKIRSSR
jgi:cell shape-determining protein MreC